MLKHIVDLSWDNHVWVRRYQQHILHYTSVCACKDVCSLVSIREVAISSSTGPPE